MCVQVGGHLSILQLGDQDCQPVQAVLVGDPPGYSLLLPLAHGHLCLEPHSDFLFWLLALLGFLPRAIPAHLPPTPRVGSLEKLPFGLVLDSWEAPARLAHIARVGQGFLAA